MIKLIASDMDGTLVTGHIDISDFTAKAIKKAQESGITFVVATGRNYQEAEIPLKNAGIECSVIGVNGAAIFDKDGNSIRTVALDKEIVLQLIDLLEEFGLYAELGTNKGIFSENHAQRIEFFAQNIAESLPHLTFKQAVAMSSTAMQFFHIQYVKNLREIVLQKDIEVLKFFVMSHDGNVSFAPFRKKVAEENLEVIITSSGEYNIEINHINAQKGLAVKALADKLGIEASEVMTIGDSFNDVSMLEYAGVSFAMGNAHDEVKKHAKYITGTNEENGVGTAILRAIEENL
ncbi:hypothetical protein SAMN02745116_00589 [Pilibacter termitis]|uniref:Haloacid dehalogenase-like hydrolase n=1 Tax=Pilibacter termitis TaxID=263852 RepID=A0A1T4LAV4_9ENTE|nr:Cof-type HAD-IIB family hydrolase [Pilibacter termitis]SJZ51617.1 hypothetical protein SAMN02745116_00589 [Pilibacter termitis]